MVAAAVSGRRTIRTDVAEDGERAMMALTAQMEFCAKSYCHCQKTEEMVFDECVEFMVERFGMLNIGEIRQAFRLAAAGELENVTLEAYFGTFTVGMLGKLLFAYCEYRKRVVAEVVAAEKLAEYAETVELRSEKHDLTNWSEKRLAWLRGKEDLSVEHCTAFDFEHFKGLGELELPDEARRKLLWKDALALAFGDVNDAALRGDFGAKQLLLKLGAGQKDEGFYQKRLMYYRRLLVVDWIKSIDLVHP